jgi:TetR/AcrR family fatty acid metabolism transcriptional regulator
VRQVAKEARILEAASRVFAGRPYHRVQMEHVARAAGVGKGTLYRYFASKEHLYLAVTDEAFRLLVEGLERDRGDRLDPPTALRQTIASIVDTFARHLPFLRLMHEGDARLVHRRKQVILARRERIAAVVAEALDRGAEAGVFRKVDRGLATSMLIGIVWGTTLSHGQELPAEVLAARVAELYLFGVVALPAGGSG